MAIQEFASRPSPEGGTRERLSDERLGNLIIAVGNHEAKALLIASMNQGTGYASTDLDRLFELRQGRYSVWRMKIVPFYSYCKKSFARAGLVEVALRDRNLEASRYALTDYGSENGVALAGHLLDYSEKNPDTSLIHIFGNNPITRIQIFREILAGNLPLREADLVKALGKTAHLVGDHLGALKRHGLITYESTTIDKPYARFRVSAERPDAPPPIWAHNVTLTNGVYKVIQDNPNIEISAESIYPVLAYRNPKLMLNEDDKMNRITYVLTHLEKHGYLKRIKFGLYRQSEITLTEDQRRRLSQLMDILDKFSSQDPSFLAEGRSKAHQIANDPRRFSSLLFKARETSSSANGTSSEETMKQILSILYSHPQATNSEIQEYLRTGFERDLSRERISRLTQILRGGGFIFISEKGTGFHFEIPVVKTKKGPYSYSSKEGRIPFGRKKSRTQVVKRLD